MILVLMVLVVSTAGALYGLSQSLPLVFGAEWDMLTNPNSGDYHSMFAPLILFEVSYNVALGALAASGVWLFFKRSPHFQFFVIALGAGGILATIVDEALTSQIPTLAFESTGFLWQISKSAFLIWYVLASKRVKNTFADV